MRVLVVGRGAREHAIVWRLAKDPSVSALYAAPGNPGTASLAENLPIAETDGSALSEMARSFSIDLVVIGPEAPLAHGVADTLRKAGCAVLGPSQAAARLESSKAFAKEVMAEAGVPTAPYTVVTDLDDGHRTIDASSFPLVVKADGLAQGKGVVVAPDRDTAHEALEALLGAKTFGEAGSRVLLETCLTGPEVSAFALTDGQRILGLPFVQDHKRLNIGDTGPNTGGMGAVTDPAFLPPDASSEVAHTIFRPVLRTMRRRHTPFRGILYAGLMWTQKGPMVLEFNVRMGDPEAEALLPGLTGDLASAFHAAASGTLDGVLLGRRSGFGVSVVAVADGYPVSPVLGDPIEYDPAAARSDDSFLFHAGTVRDASGILRVSGGRVVVAAAWKSTRNDAKRLAYEHLSRLSFPGMHVRQDIGDTAGEDVQM